ncbi:MAG: hypothetical protein ABIJ14_00660 [Nanoarchaeota archaeon]
MGDNAITRIKRILEKNNNGLTITELVDVSKLSRSAVRTALAELKGAKKVSLRKIGMAKVYLWIKKRGEK